MSANKRKFTDSEKTRMLQIAKLLDGDIVSLVEFLLDLEKRIPDLNAVLAAVKGKDGGEGKQGDRGPAGKDATEYSLTKEDKREIALIAAPLIKVPVIEKVIEKSEIVREIPVIRETIIKEIVKQTSISPETLGRIEMLNGEIEKLRKELAERLESPPRFILGSGSRSVRVFKNGTGVSKNVIELNFVDAQGITAVGQAGRRVNITVGAAGMTVTPLTLVPGQTAYTGISVLPKYIFTDSSTLKSGFGYALSGSAGNYTVTFDIAPQSWADIIS